MDRAGRAAFAMFLVAPLPYVALQLLHTYGMLPPTSLIGAMWLLFVAAVLGYPAAALIGIPAHLFLIARGWTNIFVYALLGPVVTFGFHLVLIALRFDWTFLQHRAEVGACSVTGGILFWLIARPDRPDRLRPAAPRTADGP